MLEYWFINDIGNEGYSFPDAGPNVSKVNLHTSIWALLEIHMESTKSKESSEVFKEALEKIQEIKPVDLYNLLIDHVPDFQITEQAVRFYAEKIICFNREEVYAR